MTQDSSAPQTQSSEYEALKALYLKIRQLKETVGANKISFYRPHAKQRDFHAAELCDVRVVLGGNRSGKTTCGAVEAVAHALGERPWLPNGDPHRLVRLPSGDPIPVPNTGRIAIKTFEVNILQTVHPKLMEWAPAGAITNIQKNPRGVPIRYDFANGSVIHLMSYDQDPDSFEGPNGHWFWCDEPPPQRIFNALRRGLVDFSGHCWLTMTPLSEPWTNQVLVAKANNGDGRVWMRRMSIWDNAVSHGGHLPDKAIESFLEDLPVDERASREHGKALHLAGTVFPEWVAEEPFWMPLPESGIPRSWPRVCVIDPHPRKPIAVLWVAVSPDNQLHAYRELFDPALRTVAGVVERMREMEGWHYAGERRHWAKNKMIPIWRRTAQTEPVVMYIIDTSANEMEKTSGETVSEQFGDYGIQCTDAYKRNKDAGINAIHEALRLKYEWSKPGLVVYHTCPTVRNNFENYIYERWGSSKLQGAKGEKQTAIKANDDMIDCIRYVYQMRLTHSMLRSMANALAREETDGRRYPGPTQRSREGLEEQQQGSLRPELQSRGGGLHGALGSVFGGRSRGVSDPFSRRHRRRA